jgi:hypothetical protein
LQVALHPATTEKSSTTRTMTGNTKERCSLTPFSTCIILIVNLGLAFLVPGMVMRLERVPRAPKFTSANVAMRRRACPRRCQRLCRCWL